MCVATAIKEAREKNNLTQQQVANIIGVARSTYSSYERKERTVPDDVVMIIASELNSPQIMAEFTYEHNLEFFNTPVLNNVDKHPQVIIDTLVEESSEMIKALMQIKRLIKNKMGPMQLSDTDYEKLLDLEEQVGDVYTALKMHFISMQSMYGIDVRDIEKRCNNKLKRKGYIKKSTLCKAY